MTERVRRSLTPAMVVAFIALFAALSGGTYAATKLGTKNLRNGAVTNKKLRNGAVTNRKLRRRAVSISKLREGAVGTTKIRAAAVTATQLAPGERGEGFVSNRPAAMDLVANTSNTVATLSLPPGAFVVTAATSLGGRQAGSNFIPCILRDDGAVVTGGEGFVDFAAYMESVTLTGVSNGGTVTMACTPSAPAAARSRTITAVRVGSLQVQ